MLPAAAPAPAPPRQRFLRPAPAPAAPRSRPGALRRACPIKLKVSSTRSAPTGGWSPAPPAAPGPRTPSSARPPPPCAQSAGGPGPSRSAACGTPPGFPWKRRLFRAHAVQDQLPAPVHHRRLDHLIITDPGIGLQDRRRASRAGGTGGCPFGLSAYACASSAWNSPSNSSCRYQRKNTNSFARRTALITACSAGEGSTGGRHTAYRPDRSGALAKTTAHPDERLRSGARGTTRGQIS